MNKTIAVRIISLSYMFQHQQVTIAIMSGEDGVLGVLPGHAPFIINLKPGLIKLSVDNTELEYFVDGGIADITHDNINILTKFAILTSNINKDEIIEKLTIFKEQLKNETKIAKIEDIRTNIKRYEMLLEEIS